MVSSPHNFGDAALRARINATLATPRFKIGELLNLTTPAINREVFNDWRKRGLLALDLQLAVGTAKELRAVADLLGPPRSTVHTFTGGDCLKTLTLDALSSCGVGFYCVPEIHGVVLRRAAVLLCDPDQRSMGISIYRRNGETTILPDVDDLSDALLKRQNLFAFIRLQCDDMIRHWLSKNAVEQLGEGS